MYLDTDVVLARLKPHDWLRSDVDVESLDSPVTSTATAIEVQYAMQEEWSRETLSGVTEAVREEGVAFVPLSVEDVESAERLRESYDRLGVFDSVHLAAAWTRDLSIVSTDSLYPSIREVEHLDPRELR